jgi:hypothetical protein
MARKQENVKKREIGTVANGKQPTLRMFDELDGLVWTYGREAVLKMFMDAMPKHYMNMDKYIVYGTRQI